MTSVEFVKCPYCDKKLKFVTPTHLKTHNKTIEDLRKDFPNCQLMCELTIRKITTNSRGEKKKKSINYIKNYLFKENLSYKIISKIYKNSYTKLEWECENGHRFFMTWTSFQQGTRCPACFGTPKRSDTEVNSFLKSIDYKWISNKYINIYSKLKVECNNGHISEIRFDQLKAGHLCHECHNVWKRINFSGEGNPNWRGGLSYEPYCNIWSEEFKEYIKWRDGYRCLNPYCYSLNKENLVVHHINYIKKDCNQYNLITICNTCNTMANFYREWHKSWYSAIIYMRYKQFIGEKIR